MDPAASEPARFKNKRIQASGDMIREESEPEVVPISPSSTLKPSSTVTKSSKSHPYSLQALNMNQPAKTAASGELREKEELTLRMSTNLQLRRQKPSLRGALPDLKLVKSPTPVPMERLLMLEANVLNIFSKDKERLQTLTLPRKVRGMTEKVIVILSLTVKCKLLDLSSLIDLKIKIL